MEVFFHRIRPQILVCTDTWRIFIFQWIINFSGSLTWEFRCWCRFPNICTRLSLHSCKQCCLEYSKYLSVISLFQRTPSKLFSKYSYEMSKASKFSNLHKNDLDISDAPQYSTSIYIYIYIHLNIQYTCMKNSSCLLASSGQASHPLQRWSFLTEKGKIRSF